MMLGKENSVLKMILMFEALKQKTNEGSPRPPKRNLASLLAKDAPPEAEIWRVSFWIQEDGTKMCKYGHIHKNV